MQVVEAKGARIPLVGLGTWELRGRVCSRIVEQALRLGYRHIDTAEMYDNEREVGEGLRASGVPRDEVFVTTKVWPSHFAPRELVRAAKESLAKLRLSRGRSAAAALAESADPAGRNARRAVQGQGGGACPPHRRVELHRRADRGGDAAVERAAGLQPVRDASVSRSVEGGRAPAARTAWRSSPIARSRAATPRTTRCSRASARRTARRAAQVSLRYLVQQDIVVIPRTSKIERLTENLAIFDFALGRRDMAEIARARARRRPHRRLGLFRNAEVGLSAAVIDASTDTRWCCFPAGRTPPSAWPGRSSALRGSRPSASTTASAIASSSTCGRASASA